MKKIIICLVLLVIAENSFCQQGTPSQPYTREDYLAKSKNQKGAARALLIVGGIVLGTSILIGVTGDPSFETLGTLAVVGGIGAAATLTSIPLFIASARNKNKGMAATASVKFETTPSVKQTVIVSHAYPAAAIKINL